MNIYIEINIGRVKIELGSEVSCLYQSSLDDSLQNNVDEQQQQQQQGN